MSSLSGLPLPIPVGTADVATSNATKLGYIYEYAGKLYVMVKASAAIATAAGRGLEILKTAGVPVWTVTYPASATTEMLVAVPAGQVGVASATALASGEYFLAQIWGSHTALLAAGTATIWTALTIMQANTTGLWANYTGSGYPHGGSFSTSTTDTTATGAFTGWISTII